MLCIGLEQKNVIIQRDRFGYGLTVSGDNPVYVLSVREGGAAHRAGINTNDQIIKVRMWLFNSISSLRRSFILFS
jgi:S1-C subfamily serine protease